MLGLGLQLATAMGGKGAALNPPANTALPTITGSATVGSVLTAGNGTWTNSPTAYAYQWRVDGATIAGATAATYTPVAGDVGKKISVRVTATNADGSTAATSTETAAITASAAKTEADFLAHITALGTTPVGWTASAASTGLYRTTLGAPEGVQWGSSWGTYYYAQGLVSRAIQHGLPSLAALTDNIGAPVMFRVDTVGTEPNWASYNRNGYSSAAAENDPGAAATMTRLVRWDRALGKAFESNPRNQTAETEYTWEAP